MVLIPGLQAVEVGAGVGHGEKTEQLKLPVGDEIRNQVFSQLKVVQPDQVDLIFSDEDQRVNFLHGLAQLKDVTAAKRIQEQMADGVDLVELQANYDAEIEGLAKVVSKGVGVLGRMGKESGGNWELYKQILDEFGIESRREVVLDTVSEALKGGFELTAEDLPICVGALNNFDWVDLGLGTDKLTESKRGGLLAMRDYIRGYGLVDQMKGVQYMKSFGADTIEPNVFIAFIQEQGIVLEENDSMASISVDSSAQLADWIASYASSHSELDGESKEKLSYTALGLVSREFANNKNNEPQAILAKAVAKILRLYGDDWEKLVGRYAVESRATAIPPYMQSVLKKWEHEGHTKWIDESVKNEFDRLSVK